MPRHELLPDTRLMPNNSDFQRALEFTLQWEGGYVNHPDDPGGETKFGISKRAYPKLNIASLTKEQAASIYLNDYWIRGGCDKLAWPLNAVAFDTAVNCGIGAMTKMLQEVSKDELKPAQDMARTMIDLRIHRYKSLIVRNPKLKVFMTGWQNRCNKLLAFISEA